MAHCSWMFYKWKKNLHCQVKNKYRTQEEKYQGGVGIMPYKESKTFSDGMETIKRESDVQNVHIKTLKIRPTTQKHQRSYLE